MIGSRCCRLPRGHGFRVCSGPFGIGGRVGCEFRGLCWPDEEVTGSAFGFCSAVPRLLDQDQDKRFFMIHTLLLYCLCELGDGVLLLGAP